MRLKLELAEVPQPLQAHLDICGRGMADPTPCVVALVGDLLHQAAQGMVMPTAH
jgi:hypothetical protein